MSFSAQFSEEAVHARLTALAQVTDRDVLDALSRPEPKIGDFEILLSPTAARHIEAMAQKAHHLTVQRFGRTMQMFIPLYISNVCYNRCTYCGFSMDNKIDRVTLTLDKVRSEAALLHAKGFRHILILTGEAPDHVGAIYIRDAIREMRPYFDSISIEVQPLSEAEYRMLIVEGVDGLTLYQETYHHETYLAHHLSGKKRLYAKRLDALEGGARAGFHRINVGALMGLYDWRFEAIALADHLRYLMRAYWQTQYAVSFPRIQGAEGGYTAQNPVHDRDLVQLITAFRIAFPDLGITLSTREAAALRDHLVPLGITQMSAESNTAPGGYSGSDSLEQFEISDERPLVEVQKMLLAKGYEPVMKNWDASLVATVTL